MYKITLFDETTDGCVSGTATFFTDDLALFEKHCISEKNASTQERYFRSKDGEEMTEDLFVTPMQDIPGSCG